MCFLKISAANLWAWHLCRDCQNRNTTAMTIEKPIDKVQIARTAAARTHRDLVGEMSLCTGCKGGDFFVAHVEPLYLFTLPNCLGHAVQRIACIVPPRGRDSQRGLFGVVAGNSIRYSLASVCRSSVRKM